MLFFNKKIAKSLNWDPYAQVKNNQWTVSELRRVTKAATRDLDGKSGMTAADQWGMAQIDPGTAGMMALLTGSNLEKIKGFIGKFTYNMDNKDIINTINKMYINIFNLRPYITHIFRRFYSQILKHKLCLFIKMPCSFRNITFSCYNSFKPGIAYG